MAYPPLRQGALQIPFCADLLPELSEVLLCPFESEAGLMLFVFQKQLYVCLNGLQVVRCDLIRLLVLAAEQHALPVGFHDAEVGTLYKAVDVVLPVAGQVNIVGVIAKVFVQPAEDPAQPVVGFDMVVGIIEPLRPGEVNVRFMSGGEVTDVAACLDETAGSASACIENKYIHGTIC